MVRRFNTRLRVCVLVGLLAVASAGSGCTLSEALVDGFFGGISDIVATVVSNSALGAVSSAAP